MYKILTLSLSLILLTACAQNRVEYQRVTEKDFFKAAWIGAELKPVGDDFRNPDYYCGTPQFTSDVEQININNYFATH